MFQLIYASTATRRLEEGSLRALVERARERNEQRGITGVLVHRNGAFLHVLEGEEEQVRALYERIRADERHRWVTMLKAASLGDRDFPDTPLGFQDRSVAGARGHGPGGPARRGSEVGGAYETLIQFQRANARGDADPGDLLSEEADAEGPGAGGAAAS